MRVFNLSMEGYWREVNRLGIPDFSGVFFVYESRYDSIKKTVELKQLLFVDEAENIKAKIISHPNYERWKSFLNINNELCFSVCYVAKEDRVRVARAIIFKHQPAGNNKYEGNFPYDETVIAISGKTNDLIENNYSVKGY